MKVYVEMANTREKRLKLGLLNVRSLKTGQDEFMAMILKYKIDVLAINESWIRDGDGKRRLHLLYIITDSFTKLERASEVEALVFTSEMASQLK
jgi:hypothetical protein